MKTLNISFTESPSAPAYGYKILYRVAGSSGAYTQVSPNPTSSPVHIAGLADSTDYEGSVQAMCTRYGGSNPVSFTTVLEE